MSIKPLFFYREASAFQAALKRQKPQKLNSAAKLKRQKTYPSYF
jgi:hypothetical protein